MKSFQLSILSAAALFSSIAFAAPVNINTAAASEIAGALNGIGITKAEAIVAFREQNGRFMQPGDIVQVKGVGAATFEKNKADILVD